MLRSLGLPAFTPLQPRSSTEGARGAVARLAGCSAACLLLAIHALPAPAGSALSLQEVAPGATGRVDFTTWSIGTPPPLSARGDSCETLVFHADGTYENGFAWRNEANEDEYGSFAEFYDVEGPVCSVILDFSQTGLHVDETMDVYVWEDLPGEPGAVVCVLTDLDPGPIALWPSVSRHVVEVSCELPGPFWAGFHGNWSSPNAWFIAADLDGPPGVPRTYIRPGQGYPSGWQDVSVVWGPTASLGIGAFVGSDPPPPPPNTLQELIDQASDGETVWIPAGVYAGPGNRDLDFRGKNIAFRSLAGPLETVIDAGGVARGFLFTSGESAASLVEGFTIRDGHAAGAGGGILCSGASPTIRDCILESGTGAQGGGAIALFQSSAVVEDCVFTGNAAVGTNGNGGALHVSQSAPSISRCEMTENAADASGGGVYFLDSAGMLIDCRIAGNEADLDGGGVAVSGASQPEIAWSRITGNRARNDGGGVHSGAAATPLLRSSTLASNVAAGPGTDRGSGIYAAGTLAVERTILWNNCDFGPGAEIFADAGADVAVSCSAIDPSGVEGPGTVSYIDTQVLSDPDLCAPADPCPTQPTASGNYHVSDLSPCLPVNSPCGNLIGALWIRCPYPLLPDGACCLPDGMCLATAEELCEPYGGTFLGNGTVCEPGSCDPASAPPPAGAGLNEALVMSAPQPNPSSGALTFTIETRSAATVEVGLFDAQGSRVAPLVAEKVLSPGTHRFFWGSRTLDSEGRQLSSGVYYVRLRSGPRIVTERFVVIR